MEICFGGKGHGQNTWPWVSVLCCSEREAGQVQEGLEGPQQEGGAGLVCRGGRGGVTWLQPLLGLGLS